MIRHGLERDPTLAAGYQALVTPLCLMGRYDDALLAAERGVELGPGNAENLVLLGLAQVTVAQYTAALANIERAIALNPLAAGHYHGMAAAALYALDRYGEASRNAAAAIERSPGFSGSYIMGAASDMALGSRQDAAARIAAMLRHSPGITTQSPIVAKAYERVPALHARFVQHLREAGMPGSD